MPLLNNRVLKLMKRNQLSVRARTTVGEKLPNDWETKVSDYQEFVKKDIDNQNLTPSNVYNMDEAPMSFDIPATRTVADSGSKTVAVTTTGHKRTCFTIVLGCSAAGDKLPPMVIFKRATMPRETLPSGVVVVCNKKGWMNNEAMKEWIDKCYRARRGGFFQQKSLLIFDAMAANKEASVHKHINSTGAHIAVILGGLTCRLQSPDIAVNHPFKCHIRNEWDKWMREGVHTFTPAGKDVQRTLKSANGF